MAILGFPSAADCHQINDPTFPVLQRNAELFEFKDLPRGYEIINNNIIIISIIKKCKINLFYDQVQRNSSEGMQ